MEASILKLECFNKEIQGRKNYDLHGPKHKECMVAQREERFQRRPALRSDS